MTCLPTRPPSFQLRLPGFEGPLPDYVSLVDRRDVPASDVCVSAITSQYVTHVGTLDVPDLEDTGDFLRAATRLMVLKSALLLPTPVEVEVAEAEEEQMRPTVIDPSNVAQATEALRRRDGLESVPAAGREHLIPRRVQPRSPAALSHAWREMVQRLEGSTNHLTPPAFVRVETTLSQLIRSLRTGARLSFSRLLRGATRSQAVLHFIATLELVRRRQARADQSTLFGDIVVIPQGLPSSADQQAG